MKRRSFVAAIFAMCTAVIAMVTKLFGLDEAKAAPPKCAPAQGPQSICFGGRATEVWENGDVLSYFVEQSIRPTFDEFRPVKIFLLTFTGHYHVGEKDEMLARVPIVVLDQEGLRKARLAVRGILSKYPPSGQCHKHVQERLDWIALEMAAPLAQGISWRTVAPMPHAWPPYFPRTDQLV